MNEVSAVLGLIYPPLQELRGLPYWVFLLVVALTSVFLLGYLVKGTQVWWQLRSAVRAVQVLRKAGMLPDAKEIGRAFKSWLSS